MCGFICETSSSSLIAKHKPTNASGAAAAPRARRHLYNGSDTKPATQSAQDGDDGDDETRHRNQQLHRRFVKKLGHPDAMAWRSRRAQDDGAAGDEDGDAEDADEDESPAPAKAKKKAGREAKKNKKEPEEKKASSISKEKRKKLKKDALKDVQTPLIASS